jgi:hypothetical protein
LRKVTSCWWYTRYISEDARTYECQTWISLSVGVSHVCLLLAKAST